MTVFAAASLKNALDAVNAACEAEVGEAATVSYAASSALAKQIEEGAPADVFMSADLDWMKYLSDKNLIKTDTETKLLGNQIVLVAPADSTVTTIVGPNFDLAGLLGDGEARHGECRCRAGRQIRQGLAGIAGRLGLRRSQGRAGRERARGAALVSTGEAPLGIVYKTDAAADPKVKVVGTFPEDSHPPIIYPVAQTAGSRTPKRRHS